MLAEDTLDKARFFALEAARVQGTDPLRLRHYLEAAIVFSRSVTLHVQKEFAHQPGFEKWYQAWQARLGADATAKFFLEKRNYILKAGPLAVSRDIVMVVTDTVALRTEVGVVLVYAEPWYRRRWRQNARQARQHLSRALRLLGLKPRSQSTSKGVRPPTRTSRADAVVTVRFADVGWDTQPALDLLGTYLDRLEDLVADCKRQFRQVPPNGAAS